MQICRTENIMRHNEMTFYQRPTTMKLIFALTHLKYNNSKAGQPQGSNQIILK